MIWWKHSCSDEWKNIYLRQQATWQRVRLDSGVRYISPNIIFSGIGFALSTPAEEGLSHEGIRMICCCPSTLESGKESKNPCGIPVKKFKKESAVCGSIVMTINRLSVGMITLLLFACSLFNYQLLLLILYYLTYLTLYKIKRQNNDAIQELCC